MPVGLERLNTMAEKDKKNNKKVNRRDYWKESLKAEKERMKKLYESRQTPYERKEAKRTEDNVKEVMEGLNVSKEEAEKIVRDTLFRGKRRLKNPWIIGESIIDFGTKEGQKEGKELLKKRRKKLRRQKKLQTGKEVNKGGLLKKKNGGKVYSRGSRKPKYNG